MKHLQVVALKIGSGVLLKLYFYVEYKFQIFVLKKKATRRVYFELSKKKNSFDQLQCNNLELTIFNQVHAKQLQMENKHTKRLNQSMKKMSMHIE